MNIIDGFTFKSKKRLKLEQEKFSKSMYHLGEGHEDLIKEMLETFIGDHSPKHNPHFTFLALKSYFLEHESSFLDDFGNPTWVNKWYRSTLMLPEDKIMLLSYVKLDSLCQSFSEYPTKENIKDSINEILNLIITE